MTKVQGATGVMIGDSTWDCIAAGQLGIPTLALRTGGFSTDELTDAGAAQVFSSLMHIPRLISTNDENARLLVVSKQHSQKSSAVRLA